MSKIEFNFSKMKKRGISDVVTTVLIILLALAAVFIVWSFIRPAITRAGEGLSGAECINKDVVPVGCNAGSNIVTFKNNKGDETTVRLIIEKEDGSTVTEDALVGGFETGTFNFFSGPEGYDIIQHIEGSQEGDKFKVVETVENNNSCSISDFVYCTGGS